MVVLVTGSAGQLGQSLQFLAPKFSEIQFVFCDSSTLDITNLNNVKQIFNQFKPSFCINAAAYTAVDKAESEPQKAIDINVTGSKNLAEVCKQYNSVLLHISTDFVFDGNLSPRAQSLDYTETDFVFDGNLSPRAQSMDYVETDFVFDGNLSPRAQSMGYTETDVPNPTGVYGQTKLDGELAIQNIWEKYFIIRTSWVYSQFGNNFMKTMLRLAAERDSISVVTDQIGTPTNAVDLAEVILTIICHTERSRSAISLQPTTHNLFGIYNFSNEGQCSWYDFAKKIFEINNVTIDLKPIPTSSFPTPAKRPSYSVLDKSKIKTVFNVEVKNWEESLKHISFLL